MTEEEYDNAPKLDQLLYDCTGMIASNHEDIAKAMQQYADNALKEYRKQEIEANIEATRVQLKKHPFKEGDVVALKCGELKMVVDEVKYSPFNCEWPKGCICVWHDKDNKPVHMEYKNTLLMKYEDPTP